MIITGIVSLFYYNIIKSEDYKFKNEMMDNVTSTLNEIDHGYHLIPKQVKSLYEMQVDNAKYIKDLRHDIRELSMKVESLEKRLNEMKSRVDEINEKTSEDESNVNPVLDIEFIGHDGSVTHIPDMVLGVRLKGKTYLRMIEYNDEGKWFYIFKDREYIDNEINKMNKK